MLIYLIRHAIAVPHGTPGVEEHDRPLTPDGVRKMHRNIRGLLRLGVKFDEIWTSPLVRARQTAELLADDMHFRKTIHDVDDLRPGADFTLLAHALGELGPKRRLALVGHEPDLGELATWLLTGLRSSAIQFKKGGAACIEADHFDPPSDNLLHWLLTPKQMARLTRRS